eukprot:tig00000227_g19800.t1
MMPTVPHFRRTLLDALAGRKTVGSLTGEIRLNGRPVDPRTLPRVSSYVEQFDLLYPSMTVREAVVMSALTRLDAGLPRAAKLEAPTTGLDSSAALRIGRVRMRARPRPGGGGAGRGGTWGRAGRGARPLPLRPNAPPPPPPPFPSSFPSHPPGPTRPACETDPLFFLFDYLILLGSGGLPVFCGELGERSSSVLSFFASLGYAMPPLRNPADFIIEARAYILLV